ncbi:unnamed protein product [Prunus armeniaca]
MTLSSRWKILNKELAKWRDALAKAMNNHRSGENLSNKIIQAQMWFGATGSDGGVERDTSIGFTYGFPDESRLTYRKGAEAYWEEGGEGEERE